MPTDLNIGDTELSDLCRQGAYEKIGAAFSGAKLPIASLSHTALKLFKELLEGNERQRIAITLAVLYASSPAELSKLRFWPGYFNKEVLNEKTLSAVPKERLQILAEVLLNSSPIHFEIVRELHEAGMIDKIASSGYAAGLISVYSWPNKNSAGLANTLLEYKDFLSSDVWFLFQYDGTADSCLAGADKYLTNAGESWESVLVSFANQGLLDRDRLLNESLRALSRDFNQFRSGWFSRFHEAMQPTANEKTARLPLYLGLLSSSVPPTVSFSMGMILDIDKVAPIAFSKMSAHLSSALTSRSKQTVLSTIKLLNACARREPTARAEICSLACTALVSDVADIQNSVLKLLTEHADKDDSHIKSTVAAYAGGFSASARKNIPAFLQSNEPEPQTGNFAPDTIKPINSLAARLLTPIADLHELVLKAALVLENHEAYCEYELVLDAILRNCGRDASDFALRTSSLLKRANKLDADGTAPLTRCLCRLIILWITGVLPTANPRSFSGDNAFRDLQYHRLEAITERVRKRDTAPLLSLPTDEYGWLEADELRRRLTLGTGDNYDALDRALAILRVRDADQNLIDQVAAGSSHPAVVLAKQCKNKRILGWSVERRNSHNFTFTSIKLNPEPHAVFPEGLLALQSGASSTKWSPWEAPTAQEALLAGSLTPNLRQIYFACGVRELGNVLQYTDVSAKALRHYLHFLYDPAIQPEPMGSLLLALSISTGDQDISVAGVDAFIMLIEQRRFDFQATGDAMRILFHDGDCIKANRWSKHLGTIARTSSTHSRVMYDLLQHVLATPLPTPPKDLHHVLELLVELHAEHNGKLMPEVSISLSAVKVGGKTKRLIDQLNST